MPKKQKKKKKILIYRYDKTYFRVYSYMISVNAITALSLCREREKNGFPTQAGLDEGTCTHFRPNI